MESLVKYCRKYGNKKLATLAMILCSFVPAQYLLGRSPLTPPPLPQIVLIYGYNQSIVVAKVFNATKNQVAYTSFESDDKGYWTYSGSPEGSTTDLGRTGSKYYNVSTGQIQRTGLPAGRYILSYWATADLTISGTNYSLVSFTNGSTIKGWSYFEKVINISAANGVVTLSGSAKIDELRLYPFDAQMTTFTYDPLIGKTSETDANNITIFYEYDGFNRLINVKDQNGNIVKNNYFQYINQ